MILEKRPERKRNQENRKVVEALRKNGDALIEPREVDHFAYFPHPAARNQFQEWAQKQGFDVVSADSDDNTFGLQLTRFDAVDADSINEVTRELEEKAIALGGQYDVWGCAVIRDDSKPQGSWFRSLFAKK